MAETVIVPVLPQDVHKLCEISIATFREAFGSQNAAGHMDAYIAEAMNEERLEAEVNNKDSRFSFAYVDGVLSGYLKVNFNGAQTEQPPGNAMEIERIYVYAAAYGKGVGQALFEKALELAMAAGVDYVWLGVWEHNMRAQQFYRKNGFAVFGKHIFYLGSDAQTDVLMKRLV